MTSSAQYGQRVKIYRNLRRKVWSVVSLERGEHYGHVIAHVNSIVLSQAHARVSEAGRQRVIATHQKNVHAFISGTVTGFDTARSGVWGKVRYNPYKHETFVWFDGLPATSFPDEVIFTDEGEVFARHQDRKGNAVR